jgi:pilus assembly protein Flp/PilA
MKSVVNLFRSEEGQGMVEYGLIIALVAVVAIAGLILLGPKIRDMFKGISDNLTPSAT